MNKKLQSIYEMRVGKKLYIGRTREDVEQRIKDHEKLLIQGRHYNKFMQKEYDINPELSWNLIHKDIPEKKCSQIYANEIDKKETYNRFKGLNHFLDRKTRNSSTYKTYNSSEDIIFHYLDCRVYKETQEEFNINYITLIYHLNKNWVLNDSKPTVPSKLDMIYAGAEVLVMAEKPLTSSQIVERIYNQYDVANKINFTPRQLSIKIKVLGAQKLGESPIVWIAP